MARVRTTVPFLDGTANRVRLIGHVFECDGARAAVLAARGLVEPADGRQEWPPEAPPDGRPSVDTAGWRPQGSDEAPAEPEPAGRAIAAALFGGRPRDGEAEPGECPGAADLESMTRAQLAARADELGVGYPAKANKAKLRALIEQAEAGD